MPRLLVVDDDPLVLKTLKRILESSGFQVLTAKNGLAAIEIVRSHRGEIDLLVSDVRMPEMDGKALAAIMDASYPKVPILFIPGDCHGLHLGAGKPHLVLPKPFTHGVLIGAVNRLVYGDQEQLAFEKSEVSLSRKDPVSVAH